MTLSKHKFLLLGIALAALIGAGLAVLNHYVREENKLHEVEQEVAARALLAKMPKPPMPMPMVAPTRAASGAPTRSAPPPQ